MSFVFALVAASALPLIVFLSAGLRLQFLISLGLVIAAAGTFLFLFAGLGVVLFAVAVMHAVISVFRASLMRGSRVR